MAGISFDMSEVGSLVASLEAAPANASRRAPAVLGRAATNIRNQMRKEAERSRRYFKIGYTIDYSDVTESGDTFETEIGPNRSRHEHAKLAHVAYFGGANGGGGTLPDPEGALLAEAPAVMKYLAAIAAEAI